MPSVRGMRVITCLYHVLVVIADVFAYIAGVKLKNISMVLYVHFIGIAMVMLIVVPPWPCWNMGPVKQKGHHEKDE